MRRLLGRWVSPTLKISGGSSIRVTPGRPTDTWSTEPGSPHSSWSLPTTTSWSRPKFTRIPGHPPLTRASTTSSSSSRLRDSSRSSSRGLPSDRWHLRLGPSTGSRGRGTGCRHRRRLRGRSVAIGRAFEDSPSPRGTRPIDAQRTRRDPRRYHRPSRDRSECSVRRGHAGLRRHDHQPRRSVLA